MLGDRPPVNSDRTLTGEVFYPVLILAEKNLGLLVKNRGMVDHEMTLGIFPDGDRQRPAVSPGVRLRVRQLVEQQQVMYQEGGGNTGDRRGPGISPRLNEIHAEYGQGTEPGAGGPLRPGAFEDDGAVKDDKESCHNE